MSDSMLPEQNIFEARSGFPLEKRHALILLVWAVQICCVVIGSLLSPESSVIGALSSLHISFKVLHFCAYTSLALTALISVRRRPAAVLAALAMILLGVALEFGQKLVPGRSFEVGDMFINGAGVLTGIAIGILSRVVSAARAD